MNPHLGERDMRRDATAFAIMTDQREEIDILRHDLDAWRTRALWLENEWKKEGYRLATPEESTTLALVPIEEKEEATDEL